jgi:hypothetical protein
LQTQDCSPQLLRFAEAVELSVIYNVNHSLVLSMLDIHEI